MARRGRAEAQLSDAANFFGRKKQWSKYKDLILDYYLRPYLRKVARLSKPILLVDCFAGAGRFEQGGDEGSPLILARHAVECVDRGMSVRVLLIEKARELFDRLTRNVEPREFIELRFGDFHEYLEEIAAMARSHTVFLYLDPIAPGDLYFEDLAHTYERLRVGQSVETLCNFLSPHFLRRATGLVGRAKAQEGLDRTHGEVQACDAIAGGTYWQPIVMNVRVGFAEKVECIAKEYADRLHEWFKYVLWYPIREKYSHRVPKYHLVFGTRHPDAVDLMNRAMVKARREFVGSESVAGMLFPNQPADEVVNPRDVERLVLETAREAGRTSWRLLRVSATIRKPGKYTDSELDQAIKRAIKSTSLGSNASGVRIEEGASVWPKLE
jgi:three-Cys-motif partner protein